MGIWNAASADFKAPDLTDAEWELIKELIPPAKPGGRKRELEMRAVVHAIFYVVEGGIK